VGELSDARECFEGSCEECLRGGGAPHPRLALRAERKHYKKMMELIQKFFSEQRSTPNWSGELKLRTRLIVRGRPELRAGNVHSLCRCFGSCFR